MTAVGFLLLLVALALGAAIAGADLTRMNEKVQSALVLGFFAVSCAGILLLVAGIATWLWRAMP